MASEDEGQTHTSVFFLKIEEPRHPLCIHRRFSYLVEVQLRPQVFLLELVGDLTPHTTNRYRVPSSNRWQKKPGESRRYPHNLEAAEEGVLKTK